MDNLLKSMNFMNKHDTGDIITTNKGTLYPEERITMEINKYLNSKIFIVDECLGEALSMTNTKSKLEKLPFDSFFIDHKIDYKGYSLFGILVRNVEPMQHSLNIKDIHLEIIFLEKVSNWVGMMGISVVREEPMSFNYNSPPQLIPDVISSENPIYDNNIQKSNIAQNICGSFVKSFVMNFIYFLNEPEIELVVVERSKEQNQKRISRGQLPIPPLTYINLCGKLKVYLEQLKSDMDFKYSHRFWVRGHWRTLRDKERFGKNTGQRMWIKPFIKGDGVLLQKKYYCKQTEGDAK